MSTSSRGPKKPLLTFLPLLLVVKEDGWKFVSSSCLPLLYLRILTTALPEPRCADRERRRQRVPLRPGDGRRAHADASVGRRSACRGVCMSVRRQDVSFCNLRRDGACMYNHLVERGERDMRRASTGGFLEGPSLRAFGRTLPIGGSVSAQLQMGTRIYPRACERATKIFSLFCCSSRVRLVHLASPSV